ncbi:RnfABCDGE type electron transport complex subunit B [Halomonas sp. ML-15]|uniref:RnfABCDGE type electron transport complex subunit B n=1 Tax=Halomonas sp. ML-15 TaxID=2773305 RepID=UPI001747A4B6|nr:RnfABCDGE type electron transport complex subunit B [Halomonas sp. ML-15]MBD3895104.1 RnfABCDGE type electron transport complex subunit B [Halomonas sp. ML-15]
MTGKHVLIDAIDAELPQTQCGKCGQPGCRPYAEAIAQGEAINRCPPGGERTVARLAAITGRPVSALDQPAQSPLTAYVREDECIGCTKCIQACPVDAIVGAAKLMHTVIVDQCTGCELCVAPCPVDCIDLLPHPQWQAARSEQQQQRYLAYRAHQGRRRFEARQQRLAAQAEAKQRRRAERLAKAAPVTTTQTPSLSASALRANRVRLTAALKRLTRQQQNAADDEQREALATRIAEHQSQLDALDRQLGQPPQASPPRASSLHQKRMAVNAAEQSLRKARQQLAHAERQHDPAAKASAEQQIDQASAMLEQARAALASQSPSHGQPT